MLMNMSLMKFSNICYERQDFLRFNCLEIRLYKTLYILDIAKNIIGSMPTNEKLDGVKYDL